MDSTEGERRDEQQEYLLKLLIVHQRQKILLAAVHCNAQHEKNCRHLFYSHCSPSLFVQRLQWNNFCTLYGQRAEFKRHLQMTYESFTKLLASLDLKLQVDNKRASRRGGAILPEICCTCAYDFWQVGRIPTFDFLQVCQFRPSTVFYGKQFMHSTTAKSIRMRLHHFWALNFLPPLRR
jgi:hypothetical protein